MNLLADLDAANRGSPKPRNALAGGDLDGKERLFRCLADRSRLRVLQALSTGVKTNLQIATATGLSQLVVSTHLQRLLDCGCVTPQSTGHSVLYGLSTPRLLQLQGMVDEMLLV